MIYFIKNVEMGKGTLEGKMICSSWAWSVERGLFKRGVDNFFWEADLGGITSGFISRSLYPSLVRIVMYRYSAKIFL